MNLMHDQQLCFADNPPTDRHHAIADMLNELGYEVEFPIGPVVMYRDRPRAMESHKLREFTNEYIVDYLDLVGVEFVEQYQRNPVFLLYTFEDGSKTIRYAAV